MLLKITVHISNFFCVKKVANAANPQVQQFAFETIFKLKGNKLPNINPLLKENLIDNIGKSIEGPPDCYTEHQKPHFFKKIPILAAVNRKTYNESVLLMYE